MSAHRYWRLNFLASGSNAYALAEVQFRTAAGVPLLFSGGTASAADTWGGSTPSGAADNNTATLWSSNFTTLPQWWQYDFGPGGALDIVAFTITARNDIYYQQAPIAGILQWSDDGTTFTDSQRFAYNVWTIGQTKEFAVLPNRFWRLAHMVNGIGVGYTAFAEVSMAATSGGANLCTTGGADASTTYPGGYYSTQAVDGNASTLWSADNEASSWWLYDFDATTGVAEVKILARNDSSSNRAPGYFDLQTSPDGVAWTTVQSYTPSQPWTSGQVQIFAYDVPVTNPITANPSYSLGTAAVMNVTAPDLATAIVTLMLSIAAAATTSGTTTQERIAQVVAEPVSYGVPAARSDQLMVEVLFPGIFEVIAAEVAQVLTEVIFPKVVGMLVPQLLIETVCSTRTASLAMSELQCEAYITEQNGVSLRWSDTRGASWSNAIEKSLGATGQYDQDISWRRLGQSRDRVFEISWSTTAPDSLTGAYVTFDICDT